MKKLIPALCMLLVAATLLGTSTYAWFSMNETVEATNMQVTAKSSSTFLLIGDSADVATDKTNVKETVEAAYISVGNADKKCYPVAYYAVASTLNGHATEAGKWYFTTSDKLDTAVSGNASITEITEGDESYMLTYKVWLTLSQSSEAISKKIKVTYNKTSGDAATSAVVVIGTEKFALNGSTSTATTSSAVNLTNNTAVEVTMYVYMDGNSANVYSNYINTNTLQGTLGFTFTLVD